MVDMLEMHHERKLEITGLTAGYVPGMPIIRGLDVYVDPGEIVTIIGPNGAGKSTLIKAIAGLLTIEDGQIKFGDLQLVGIKPEQMTDYQLSYVPQSANIFQGLTIEQNLVLAAQRVIKRKRAGQIAAMIDLFPALGEKLKIKAGGLSGGQRQLLAIAMAMIAEPQLILMDEPTAGLSPKASQEILQLILTIAKQGVSVLLVEQNAKAALRVSDRAYILAEGVNQHEGVAHDLLDDPVVGEIYLGAKRRAES